MDERDVGCSVGIVLNRGDLAGHAVLVTLEVDLTIEALVTTTAETRGDTAIVVATAWVVDLRDELLLRLIAL
jgi:hypothetical protein